MASERTTTRPPGSHRSRAAIVRFLGTALVVLAADLVLKAVTFSQVAGEPVAAVRDAEGRLAPIPAHDGITLLPKMLSLHLTWNEGAVFGLGQGGRWFFIPFSIIAVVVLASIFRSSSPRARVLHIALGLVLAGAIGNLYDRLRFGAVRDMLWLFPGIKLPFGWRWPGGSDELYPWIFNIADAALVLGVLLLILIMFRGDRPGVAARGST
jgi:signal peptidase II